MSPFVELRGSIPLGIFVFQLPFIEVFILSIIGNITPVPIILLFFSKVEKYLRKYMFWDKLLTRIFNATRKKAVGKIKKYESLALVIFVAIPLPLTGAWTGSLIAYLFLLKMKESIIIISIGVLIAGLIVSGICIAFQNYLWLIGWC
ncbi:MAG: small multi-drug export protein [Candidatus Thermoplasmatota archaeon]